MRVRLSAEERLCPVERCLRTFNPAVQEFEGPARVRIVPHPGALEGCDHAIELSESSPRFMRDYERPLLQPPHSKVVGVLAHRVGSVLALESGITANCHPERVAQIRDLRVTTVLSKTRAAVHLGSNAAIDRERGPTRRPLVRINLRAEARTPADTADWASRNSRG